MTTRGQDIASVIKKQIEEYGSSASMVNVGVVTEVGDAIANIHGLSGVQLTELLEFPGGVIGMAMNLEEDSVSAVILGDDKEIAEGNEVRSTGRIAEVPVGDTVIGRVMNALGEPIDGRGAITSSESRPVEKVAPNVVSRQAVNTPMQTGIKAIDSMIPIGRGQRELIIGDRSTGKSAIAIDTIINQKGGDLICIYVSIGQRVAKVAATVAQLEEYGAMDHTIVVAANASDPVALQYLAPYTGCAIGEYFMDQGKDVLIIYDDLSKHAWAYRQLSLLLKRPPGREAYPGDVFYLHSRLLERAARLSPELGGGSITALPIIETQAGDVSAYIPTNVISITDGQIYLETDLFNSGTRPAVNVGLSVSRVGGSAQTRAMRKVAGQLRLDLAQYRELVTFAQFGTDDLDDATRTRLERGQRISEVLKQPQYVPLAMNNQVVVLYAAINGFMDQVPVDTVKKWENDFLAFMAASHNDILESITTNADIDEETETKLKEAIEAFNKVNLA
ncbi:MAG: F0F1 ATP synthase subunit alpha [SAR202 cluster bacterium]|nr:F0F1 ATP synthase subunit alpha [Chloroflexota bacterium]MQG50775.1 F0F1 ATP synthase subunit alpha [SAR202 cluster bacterium]|tara:strand:- start:848 stop:2359 length:1512 start_codon:yes stop_codon:yes gene_type:complete